MSTATLPAARRAAPRTLHRASMVRLSLVEARKLGDTRAGAWLLGIGVVLAAAMTVIHILTAEAAEIDLPALYGAASLPLSILLPIAAILSVTGEWSQRGALTTFALEPRRGRITLAKVIATTVLALAGVVCALLVAGLANLVAPLLVDADGGWSIDAALLGTTTVAQIGGVLVGIGFAMMLMSTPLTIVAYLVMPTIWSVLGTMVAGLAGPAGWLDLAVTTEPLVTGVVDAEAWLRFGTSTLVWAGLPIAIGAWRLSRREVS